jgi:pullulanase
MAKTNPVGWAFKPATFSGKPTDAVFYELHVRDLGMDPNSGIQNKGKFVSLMESGTKTPAGDTTGIDAIVDLGVTHLQLLPIYDYASIDETRNDQFNWGYDPLNYNVPEGSYSTDPEDPVARVKELKQAIAYANSRGLRVVMDVVYNHVYDVTSHSFQKIVPGYYFRTDRNGNWANGTGVGNEVASERSMARKFIVESASYWAKEYRLGGFRFDLMGIHDVETMNQVRAAINKIDPSFVIIGEGWNMGQEVPAELKANQLNAYQMPGIAHFNDGIRDGLKGSVFNDLDTGWATGKSAAVTQVMEGIVGQIRYSDSLGGQWGDIQPGQSVSYVEAHDNLTLADKLLVSVPTADAAERSTLHRFASSVALLAQGVAFIHAGQEFERSKDGDHNSYKSPDSINALRWLERERNSVTVDYFKGLIEIRKAHPAFRMASSDQVRKYLKFTGSGDIISYTINGAAVGDGWKQVLVIHNSGKDQSVRLPTGSWKIAVQGELAGNRSIGNVSGSVIVESKTTMVLYQE